MTTIHRLEDPAHLDAGGVLLTYPSGYRQTLSWRSSEGVDPQAMGKALAEKALAGLMEKGEAGAMDLRETNFVSLAAGLGHMVREWASKRGG